MRPRLPVCRPRLPTVDDAYSYFHRIDASRTYSNWGPLTETFERRLEEALGVIPRSVVSASSGTSALIGAILSVAGRPGPRRLALVPAFTFVATASAAEQCGYEPLIVDVDAATWQLDPSDLLSHPQIGDAGLVIPVAPFGRPVGQAAWREFQRRTGIPIVIDGGASFEAISDGPEMALGQIPVALSFHATKSFATGEGGCVVSLDESTARAAVRALNFGFLGNRNSEGPSTNGKMSEYHAAIGLAALDRWPDARNRLRDVAARYRGRFAMVGRGGPLFTEPDIASCYTLFRTSDAVQATRLAESLEADGIESRQWYGGGLHTHPYFKRARRGPTPVTDALASTLVGLPTSPDLTDEEIEDVVRIVTKTWQP